MKLPPPKPTTTHSSSKPSSQSAPFFTHAFSEGRDLFALWGKSETELFAVGDAGTLLRSQDAGATWNKILLEIEDDEVTQNLYSIWGMNDTVFIAGADGVLLRSRDAGKTWLQMRDVPEVDLFAVWGSSSDDIFVAGKKGTLLHATDGAKFVAVPTPSSAVFYGGWTDSGRTLVCGAKGTLLRSVDQGKTWETVVTNSSVDLRSVWTRDNEIYVIGNLPPNRGIPPRTEILTSVDGATWKTFPFRGQGRAITGDDQSVYAVGAYMSSLSSDKGNTWNNWISSNQHEALRSLNGVWRSPSGKIYLVGQRGMILRKEATSLEILAGSLPVNWYDSVLLKDGSVLVSGWQGTLLKWKDASVSLLNTTTNDSLEKLVQAENKIFAFGTSGVVLKSEDEGNTWAFSQAINTRVVRDVLYRGKLFVLAADAIFTSKDGAQWSSLWSSSKQNLHSLSESNGGWYMVGERGFIATSRNATSWKTQKSGTEKDLFAVSAASETIAFAAGANGIILYTKDGGDTWEPQNSGVTQNLIHALAVSVDEVLMTGTDGVMLHTKNAGATWEKLPIPGSFAISSAVLSDSFWYIVGDDVFARFSR